MIRFFKRSAPPIPVPLHFKGADGAVEYASKYMDCRLQPGKLLPAIVLDAHEQFGWNTPVLTNDEGVQTACLHVAGDRRPFLAFAQTSGPIGPSLQPGDLVCWQAFKFVPEMGKRTSDRRTGWVGLIIGVLTPTLDESGWVGVERFSMAGGQP